MMRLRSAMPAQVRADPHHPGRRSQSWGAATVTYSLRDSRAAYEATLRVCPER